MLITNKQISKKNSLLSCIIEIVVVVDLKLLGIHVDHKLSFQNDVDHVVESVNCKLFSIKKFVFLPRRRGEVLCLSYPSVCPSVCLSVCEIERYRNWFVIAIITFINTSFNIQVFAGKTPIDESSFVSCY